MVSLCDRVRNERVTETCGLMEMWREMGVSIDFALSVHVRSWQVQGSRSCGKPMKSWMKFFEDDMRLFGIGETLTGDH